MRSLMGLVLSLAMLGGHAAAQRDVHPLPKEVFQAKTVAIVNHTHNEAVEQGALEALKRWGHFTVIDDMDAADITLTFDKNSGHSGSSTNSQGIGDDGKPTTSTSYGMTFGSSISMKAALKGGAKPVYTTTTSDSKKKAGSTCVTDFQQAYVAGP